MVLIEDQEEGADILQQAGSYFYYLKDLLVIEQVFYHLEKCVSEDSQRTVKHGGKHKTAEIENLCASELSFLRIEGWLHSLWIPIHAQLHDLNQPINRKKEQKSLKPENNARRDFRVLSKSDIFHQLKAIIILEGNYGINLVDESCGDGRHYDKADGIEGVKHSCKFGLFSVFMLLWFLRVMYHQYQRHTKRQNLHNQNKRDPNRPLETDCEYVADPVNLCEEETLAILVLHE